MKKLSLIAMAVATVLTGCGGDDSSSNNNGNNGNTAQKAEKPVIAIPAQGQFIDAKIEAFTLPLAQNRVLPMKSVDTRLTLILLMSPLFLVAKLMVLSTA
ncbi:TPA: hypothetical protein ACGFXM_002807 [Vibrio cholerae]